MYSIQLMYIQYMYLYLQFPGEDDALDLVHVSPNMHVHYMYMYMYVLYELYMYNFIDCTVAHFILQYCSLVPHVRITKLHVHYNCKHSVLCIG